MFALEINRYVYFVPFVENEDEIFLKTIFPSRKATKHYLNLLNPPQWNIMIQKRRILSRL